jgi:putative transposase
MIYRDDRDFAHALELMRKYAARYGVRIHGWCLMHNHGHWIFEASSAESISNLMRDMQSRYSYYLNRRYRTQPWLLVAPLKARPDRRGCSRYRKAGPVNWTPRFDAEPLDGAGFRSFLRYLENNPVRARLAKRADDWRWSSAPAHFAGKDPDNLLCFDRWQDLFGDPETIAEKWRQFVDGPIQEERENADRLRRQATGSPHNRPAGWFPPAAALTAASPPS